MTSAQVDQILDHGRKAHLRFGEAAVDLGVLTRDQLFKVFGPSNGTDFFALDPLYFPESTRNLFTAEAMLKYGMIPIGTGTEPGFLTSRKVLNLGLLDPAREDAVAFAEMRVNELRQQADPAFKKTIDAVKGIKVFLILADQFLGILHTIYQVPEETVRGRDAASLDSTIVMYLDGMPGSGGIAPASGAS